MLKWHGFCPIRIVFNKDYDEDLLSYRDRNKKHNSHAVTCRNQNQRDWLTDSFLNPQQSCKRNLEKPQNSSSLTEITTKCPPTLSTIFPQSLFLSVHHPLFLPTSSLQSLPFTLLLQSPFPYHTLKPHGLNPFAPNPALIYSVKPLLRTLK